MATVYILFSQSLDKFYTGSFLDFQNRISQHLCSPFPGAFTKGAIDWKVYLEIGNLSYSHARNIEAHIKKMKSKKFIQNLKQYPELQQKLIDRYKNSE